MARLNKVMIIGNLTRDPELRYTPAGTAVCEFAIALNRSYTNKQTGQKVEEVSYIDVVAWEKTAEIAGEYLKKGRLVFVEGSLKQDRWEDKAGGGKRSKIRVTAENIQFLGARPEGAAAPEPAAAEGAPAPEEDVPF